MRDTARITLVQLPSGMDDAALQASLERFFSEAAAYGSDLVAFPEYCLGNRVPMCKLRALAAGHHMYAVAGLV